MVLLAGFDALLARHSGQPDVVVGTPVANRRLVETEELIGLFVNTLVLRADLTDDPPFSALGRRVREAALEAFAHQDVPFERLVDALEVERHLAYSPLFQVMFNLQTPRSTRVELPDLTFEFLEAERGASQFDLTLNLVQWENGLTGALEYNTDLFDRATMERLLGHYQILLQGALESSDRPVSELPLLTAGERRQLAVDWNDTARPWAAGALLHELFTAQAARTPEAVAVSQGGRALTYRELDERSNRLARRLRRLGVGADVRVGLCVERTPEMVTALLGILKAGGAYVPLDPAHPAERLALVIEDSAVPVLVTEEGLLGSLPPHAAEVLCLDRDEVAAESDAPLERCADEESLAYVIYTSGSTGRPKGVQLPHRAVVNFLRAMAERPGLRAADVVPALTTLSFDIAGLEIYLPLAVGGRVEVVAKEEAADGRLLAARLAACGATLAQATPATWRLLLDTGWPGIPGLRVLCGGEALPRDLADALFDRGAVLWNVYGPTETAVWSAAGKVAAGEGPVLLGSPIANTRLHVVDRAFSQVPVGVAGELLIGGAGVARGYLGRPDLTAEKFVPDPFGAPGDRVYRTGDLVRRHAAGNLEFLGRIDHQVKVRGYRIELGEIEAALLRHPAVSAAVVVAREDGGEKRLVAYLAGEAESPAAGELRRHLREIVPEYMVPAAFVPLGAFPLTPSGKVDRKALPAPEGTRAAASGAAYVPPRDEMELRIAGIWRDVLKVDKVGAEDNFFDLGGHSLLLAQVHSRLGEALGRDLALLDLFRYPTVGSLAAHLARASGESAGPANQAGLSRAAARRDAVRTEGAVAIIGMSGRFPGANGVEAFWENLKAGVDSITFFSREELLEIGVPAASLADPNYVPARGVIEGVSEFDAPFFGYSPREAEIVDPQQRLFLECSWEAVEDAGYEPSRFPGDVGVFAGAGMNTYILNLMSDPEALDRLSNFNLMIGNDKDYLAPRVSYKLGLKGPSISVQTACSTSLVAVHLACQSLLSRRVRRRARRRRLGPPAAGSGLPLRGRDGPLARRPLPHLRRQGFRLRGRQRGRGGRAAPARRCAARRRCHPRRDPRLGGEQRRLVQGGVHRAERGGAGAGDRPGAGGGGRRSRQHRLRGGPRHRHRDGRSHRGRGSQPGLTDRRWPAVVASSARPRPTSGISTPRPAWRA